MGKKDNMKKDTKEKKERKTQKKEAKKAQKKEKKTRKRCKKNAQGEKFANKGIQCGPEMENDEPMVASRRFVPSGTPIPSRVDLRKWCSPIEDQRKTNSCCANAVVGAMEYLLWREAIIKNESLPDDLSRLYVSVVSYIYKNCCRIILLLGILQWPKERQSQAQTFGGYVRSRNDP
jgi:hypothetical protein